MRCSLGGCQDDWLVEARVLRFEDTDRAQPSAFRQVSNLRGCHGAVAAFKMMGDPTSRCVAGHVEMYAIATFVAPIPNLKHNSPSPLVAVKPRRHARWPILQERIIVAHTQYHIAVREQARSHRCQRGDNIIVA